MPSLKAKTFFFCAVLHCLFAQAAPLYHFDTIAQEKRFHSLTQQLRCLVCQNQNLAESDAALAQELKTRLQEMLLQNWPDTRIRQTLVARYGDFILLTPPYQPNTWLLWCSPLAFLTLAGLFLWRWRRRAQVGR